MNIKQMGYILFVSLLISGIAHAATDNTSSPLYSVAGVIDDIRLSENVIIVNDQIFEVVPYAKVHGHRKYPNVFVLENLKAGMIVGAKLEAVGNNPRVIIELWLLDSIPTDNDHE